MTATATRQPQPRQRRQDAPQNPSAYHYDADAEKSVIGALLMTGGENVDAHTRDICSQAIEIVAPDDFYRPQNAAIVQTIYSMFWAQKAIDVVTVAHELRERGLDEQTGGASYLLDCVESCPTTSHVEVYAKIVRKKAESRRAWRLTEAMNNKLAAGGTIFDVQPELVELENIETRLGAKRAKVFSAAELMSMEIPPQRWAIPEFLPSGFNIFAGKPKARKSWFWLQTCLAVATGGRAMGRVTVQQGEALYLALEDTPGRLKSRLRALLHNAPAPAGLHLVTDWARADEGGCQQLDTWLTNHPNCRLVVVDTLQKFRPPQRDGANAYGQDYDATGLLKKIADKHGVAIVAIHHTTKANAEDVFTTISGTLGLTGGADSIFVLAGRNEHEAILHMTGRDVDNQKIAMRWDNTLCQWNAEGDAEQLTVSEERESILDVLRAEARAMPIHEIARALQVKPENVKALLWKMKQAGEVSSDVKGRYSVAAEHKNAPSEASEALKTLFTAFTAFTVYREDESPKVDDVLQNGVIEPDLVEFLPTPSMAGQSTVNAVNAVNAKKAQRDCLEYLKGLQVGWEQFRTARLTQVAAFCWWWRETFENAPVNDDAFNAKFGSFCAMYPRIEPNCPPWLTSMQS